jgi:hypothetical protein
MAANADFSKMVPGFDFLQGLMKGAGAALPGMGQWVAPTLDPDELNKRIEELRTVQFWLEQNARLLATTIQALEVQRMTLSTLKTMNLQVGDLAEAFALRPAPAAEPRAPVAAPAAAAPERPAPAATGAACHASAGRAWRSGHRRPGGPDAVVGRADPAVHRDCHQGHPGLGHRRHRRDGRCDGAAGGSGSTSRTGCRPGHEGRRRTAGPRDERGGQGHADLHAGTLAQGAGAPQDLTITARARAATAARPCATLPLQASG